MSSQGRESTKTESALWKVSGPPGVTVSEVFDSLGSWGLLVFCTCAVLSTSSVVCDPALKGQRPLGSIFGEKGQLLK